MKYILPALAACSRPHGSVANGSPASPVVNLAVVADAASAERRSDSKRDVLGTFPAGASTFELSLEDCARPPTNPAPEGTACVFAVRLLVGGKEVDRATLPQPACGPPATPVPVTRMLGADRQASAWRTTDERCDIEVAARTVKIAPTGAALLVTELQGFEYRYRSHVLFVARDGKLANVWHEDDDALGMRWTSTAVLPGAGGGEDIALIDVSRTGEGVVAKIEAQRIQLVPTTGSVNITPLPDASASLFLLQAGAFRDARTAVGGRGECLRALDVLRSRLFRDLELPQVFVGALFARRADADAELSALASCPGAPKAVVMEYPRSTSRSHAKHH